MRSRKLVLLVLLAVVVLAAACGVLLIRRGFSATDEPSSLEKAVARIARNLAIPSGARHEENPWKATPEILQEARERFIARCGMCHANDGTGQSKIGRNLYPKASDLRMPRTQNLTDGEIHYIIRNGVRLTGMPAWGNPHDKQEDDSWKLVLFIRYLCQPTIEEKAQQGKTALSLAARGVTVGTPSLC